MSERPHVRRHLRTPDAAYLTRLLRTAAQSLAPLLFGAVADYVFGGGTSGLKWAFVVMLAPLTASALYLFRARRLYPKDVATAAEAEAQHALSTDVLSGQGQDHRDDPQDPAVTPSTAHRKHQNPQQPNAPWRLPQSPNLSSEGNAAARSADSDGPGNGVGALGARNGVARAGLHGDQGLERLAGAAELAHRASGNDEGLARGDLLSLAVEASRLVTAWMISLPTRCPSVS